MSALLTTVFLGCVVGSIYALSAFGLVLTYRASGIFNFAHGALGMLGAFAFYQLVQGGRVGLVRFDYDQTWSLPTGFALLLVVGLGAPALGWGLDVLLFRRLREAGEVVKVVVTIGLLVALQGVVGVMWGAATTLTPTSIFSRGVLEVGEFRAELDQIATILLAIGLGIGLLAFLRYTTLGVRMRAVVDRPEVAQLAGIDSGRTSSVSWAIGTSFAALGGILLAPFFGSLDPTTLIFFIVAATAAAVAGRLQSFPLTLAGGFGIGIAQLLVQRYAPVDLGRQLRPAIPFLVLFALLYLPQWRRKPSDRWSVPPLPPVIRKLSPKDAATRVGIVAGVALFAPFVVGDVWQLHFSRVPAMALIFLSLVVVSGFGGQVSLCQAALAGTGAFVSAHLVGAGVPFFLAVVIAALAVVPIGVGLAMRAASLSPLFLGFATLAFGAVMDEVAFTARSLSGGLGGIFFERPAYLQSPRAYYLVVLGIFGVVAVAVQNLRRSQTGLAWAAMRDSEVGLGALGTDVARLKLTAFSLSAALAGLGGGLLSGADQLATPLTYLKFQSLMFLALAVIGGIGSWLGAFAGAVIFQLMPPFLSEPFISGNPAATFLFRDNLESLLPVFFGIGAIGLARNPHGLVEQLRVWFTPRQKAQQQEPSVDRRTVGGVEALVAFPRGTMYHRADCVLAVKKKGRTLTETAARRLDRCPVCHPE